MLTLLSTLISFLMGGLPKLLDFFQDRSDKKHELQLAQMQTERELQMLEKGYAAQAKVEEIRLDEIKTSSAAETSQALINAQQAEMQAIYAHDTALNEGTSQWMKNFRASVRPAITYGFFLLLEEAVEIILDQALRAEAHRDAHDPGAGEQRADVDAERRQHREHHDAQDQNEGHDAEQRQQRQVSCDVEAALFHGRVPQAGRGEA